METIKIVLLCAGSFLAGGIFIYFFGWWRMNIRRLAKLLRAANENVKQLEAARDLSISALAEHHEMHRGQLLVLQNTKDASIRRTVWALNDLEERNAAIRKIRTATEGAMPYLSEIDKYVDVAEKNSYPIHPDTIRRAVGQAILAFRQITFASSFPVHPTEKSVDVSGGNSPILRNTTASESTHVE